MARFSLSNKTKFNILLGIVLITCTIFFYAFGYVTFPLVPILGIAGVCILVIIETRVYQAFKERQNNNRHAQEQKKIITQLENRTAVLSTSETDALFKVVLNQAISNQFDSLPGEKFCELFSKKSYSEKMLSDFFARFSPEQKMELLFRKYKNTSKNITYSEDSVFNWLLYQQKYPAIPLLKALMKGLSPKNYRDLINQSTQREIDASYLYRASKLFDLLISLFKEISVEDKLKFLETDPPSEPILLKILDAFSVAFILENGGDQHHQNYSRYKEILNSKKIKFLTVLFEGIPVECLKAALAVKYTYKGINMRPLDIGLEAYNIPILNFLIKYGALEADPEYDIGKLLKHPDINLTPYRNTIESHLKQSNIPDHMAQVRDLICDYLIGEAPKKAKVIS